MWLPSISCGMCCGERLAAAINFVTRSSTTMSTKLPQKMGGLGLALSIFFALLALDAISGVRQCVEALEADLATAVVTFEIGRAWCRESVYTWGVGVAW